MLFSEDVHSKCQVLINLHNALESSDRKVDVVRHTLKMVKENESSLDLPKATQYVKSRITEQLQGSLIPNLVLICRKDNNVCSYLTLAIS